MMSGNGATPGKGDGVPRGGGDVPAGEPEGTPDDSARMEEGAPIGPFPTWGALYATVVVYALGVILLLWFLTVTLDVGVVG